MFKLKIFKLTKKLHLIHLLFWNGTCRWNRSSCRVSSVTGHRAFPNWERSDHSGVFNISMCWLKRDRYNHYQEPIAVTWSVVDGTQLLRLPLYFPQKMSKTIKLNYDYLPVSLTYWQAFLLSSRASGSHTTSLQWMYTWGAHEESICCSSTQYSWHQLPPAPLTSSPRPNLKDCR